MTGLTASRLRQPAPATNKQAALYNLGRRCSSTWNPLLVNPFTVQNNSHLFEYEGSASGETWPSSEQRFFIAKFHQEGRGWRICQRHREHLCFVISADGSQMTDLRFAQLSLITIFETRDWSLKSLDGIKINLKFITTETGTRRICNILATLSLAHAHENVNLYEYPRFHFARLMAIQICLINFS